MRRYGSAEGKDPVAADKPTIELSSAAAIDEDIADANATPKNSIFMALSSLV
jgi:hypothetical protein